MKNWEAEAQSLRTEISELRELIRDTEIRALEKDASASITPRTNAEIEAVINAHLHAGTNITLSIDSVTGNLVITSTATGGDGSGGGLTAEQVRDVVATFIKGAGVITVTHDDDDDELIISTPGLSGTLTLPKIGSANFDVTARTVFTHGSAAIQLPSSARPDELWVWVGEIGNASGSQFFRAQRLLSVAASANNARVVQSLGDNLNTIAFPSTGFQTVYLGRTATGRLLVSSSAPGHDLMPITLYRLS